MQVTIKEFKIDMEVKTNGIEFEVRSPPQKDGDGQKSAKGDFLGDCRVSKSGLTWGKGKTPTKQSAKAVKIKWDEFIKIMTSEETKKAAIKAAEEAIGRR